MHDLIHINPQCTIMSSFHSNQNYFLKFLEGLSNM